jgi:hypothetical protein
MKRWKRLKFPIPPTFFRVGLATDAKQKQSVEIPSTAQANSRLLESILA